MDLLMVAREAPDLPPTGREIDDASDARLMLPKLPHGPQVATLVARLAVGVLVLGKALDRGAAGAADRGPTPMGRRRGAQMPGAPPSAGASPARTQMGAEEVGAAAASASSARICVRAGEARDDGGAHGICARWHSSMRMRS